MLKARLLLVPFFVGLGLLFCSWYLSYPLSIDSSTDVVFNHISILYWFALPLLLVSMYLLGITLKGNSYKWLFSIAIVIVIFSISYFYYLIPGSDSHFFRGLSENFISTKNLDPFGSNHYYYQWPSYFFLAYSITSISGIGVASFEFILYAAIGFLISIAIYLYASKIFSHSALLSVVAFFISLFYFINYQSVPFSLALASLFLVLMIEVREKITGVILSELLLIFGISITHAFVPLFLILYFFIRAIQKKNRIYVGLLVFTLVSYFGVQLTIANYSFLQNIRSVAASSEYTNIASSTLRVVSTQTDVIAQSFSRVATIGFLIICGSGFILLFIQKKLRQVDVAVFLTGVIYSGLGLIVYLLGSRAFSVVFLPISLGIAYLFETKLRTYLKYGILILLILFMFIPLHQSFGTETFFQTKEAYSAENFVIDHNNSTSYPYIIADYRVATYLQVKMSTATFFGFDPQMFDKSDSILCTVGFGGSNLSENLSHQSAMDNVYSNGFSSFFIKPRP